VINRRFNYRSGLDLEATCLQLDELGVPDSGARARVVELSAGGARIVLDRPLEPGSRLVLRLELEGVIDLPAIATVVGARPAGTAGQGAGAAEGFECGLRFEALDAERKALLARFVFLTVGRNRG
jgi:c-di-GMP-binding flagellar brake protein YcgR